jgi:hypothetical protein
MALRFAKATRSKVMSAGSQSRVYRDVNVHKPQVMTTMSHLCMRPLIGGTDHAFLPAWPRVI